MCNGKCKRIYKMIKESYISFSENKENLIFPTFLLIIVLSAFYQNLIIPNWDLVSYYFNGNFFTGKKIYFEVERPPVVPIILGILNYPINNFHMSILIYEILLGVILLISIYLLSKQYNLDVYIVLTSLLSAPLFLEYSLLIGTETLAMSFLLLSLSFRKRPSISGIFLSLSTLTRYNFLIFLPLIFLRKKIRDSIISALYFIIPWSIWGIYNWIVFSHPFYSFFSSYALNIYFRQYLWKPPNIINLLDIRTFGILAITYIVVLFEVLKNCKFKKDIIIFKIDKVILGVTIMFLLYFYSYYITPLKIKRYLLPLVFFLSLILGRFSMKNEYFLSKRKTLLYLLLLSAIFTNLFFVIEIFRIHNTYTQAIKDIKKIDRMNISLLISSDWVYHYLDNKRALPLGYFCRNGSFSIKSTCINYILLTTFDESALDCKLKPEWIKIRRNISSIHQFVELNNRKDCRLSIFEKSKEGVVHDYLKEYEIKHGYNPFKEVCKDVFKISTLCKYPLTLF